MLVRSARAKHMVSRLLGWLPPYLVPRLVAGGSSNSVIPSDDKVSRPARLSDDVVDIGNGQTAVLSIQGSVKRDCMTAVHQSSCSQRVIKSLKAPEKQVSTTRYKGWLDILDTVRIKGVPISDSLPFFATAISVYTAKATNPVARPPLYSSRTARVSSSAWPYRHLSMILTQCPTCWRLGAFRPLMGRVEWLPLAYDSTSNLVALSSPMRETRTERRCSSFNFLGGRAFRASEASWLPVN